MGKTPSGFVDDIADATAGPTEHPGNLPAEDVPAWRCSLDALAGQSLLHAYLALHGGVEARADAAIALLDQATDAAGVPTVRPGLYYGFSGTSWVASHLAGRLFEETQDNCVEIDETLLATLADPMWNARYELLTGVVGMGVYARERLPRPSAVRLIEAVVGRLESCAERTAAGVAFYNPVETLSPGYHDMAPRGWYNLGIAHGVAGVISFLGSLCRIGVAAERAAPLLADSVAWLLTRELPAGGDYRFKCTYTPDRDIDIWRLGWCHGDLAVATALLVAARGANEPSWEQHARRIARSAAALTVDNTPVPDASNPGFRVGSSGIALALLAAASSVPPDWDRLLMAS